MTWESTSKALHAMSTQPQAETAERIEQLKLLVLSSERADEAYTKLLGQRDWKPSRAHLEGARNAIRTATEAARELAALTSKAAAPGVGVGKDAPLTADFVNILPGGVRDNCSYSDVEDALDRADAPPTADGKWLTLPQRIAALARPAAAGSEGDAEVVADCKPDTALPWEIYHDGCSIRAVDGPHVASFEEKQDAEFIVALLRRLAARPAPVGAVPEELRKLSEAATPGIAEFGIVPCHYPECDDADLPGALWLGCVEVANVYEKYGPGIAPRYEADGKFFAAAVNYVRAALSAARQAGDAGEAANVAVDVQRMNTSRGPDFFVRFRCGGREVTPHVFRERYKAEYEAAHYAWVFGLRQDKPDLMAYSETSHPNDAPHPTSADTTGDVR